MSKVNEADSENPGDYDMIGFGAGIDSGKHYKPLLRFAESLETVDNKSCFIFSTSAVQSIKKVYKDHEKLRSILEGKGFRVLGEFSCRGFNTNLFLKYFGGMNKTHQDDDNIENAKSFARDIMGQICKEEKNSSR